MSEVLIKRDQWGRPLVPDPATGKIRAWTRATTLAGTISDRRALEQWAQRNLVRGMAAAGDALLLAAVAAGDDRDALTEVVDAAMVAAQASSSADVGTALHRITERIELGEAVNVPTSHRADVEAYIAVRATAGVSVVPGWIERFTVCPPVEAAGTMDRLVQVRGHELPMVGDLKTGAGQLEYGQIEIAAQLAVYANATHWWDGEALHEMPPIDREHALVIHMPAGTGRCDLHLIDLVKGWKIAELCYAARRVRKGRKELARPLSSATAMAAAAPPQPVAPAASQEDADADTALRERVREIVVALEGAPLPVPWPVGIAPPRRQPTPYSDAERARIERWCDRVAPKTTAAAH